MCILNRLKCIPARIRLSHAVKAVLSESMAVLLAVQWQSIDSTELSRSHVCLIQSIKYNYAIGYP